MVGLFDEVKENPHAKTRRRVILAIVVVVFVAAGLWWVLRYHKERVTILHFMNAIIAGDMQQAYQIWKPSQSYSFKDFQDDWGPTGYYGPIKSFRVVKTDHLRGGSGVEIKVRLSPYQPFPEDDDLAKQNKTKEVTLWVQFNDESISFPPF
jgi:hypothetical protein